MRGGKAEEANTELRAFFATYLQTSDVLIGQFDLFAQSLSVLFCNGKSLCQGPTLKRVKK